MACHNSQHLGCRARGAVDRGFAFFSFFSGHFHGSDQLSWDGLGQGDPARRVMLKNILARSNLTRDISKTF